MIEYKKSEAYGSTIQLSSPELMWLAESGQPYRGTLHIQYINKGLVIELISLKKYITRLRDHKIQLEEIAETIHTDLCKGKPELSVLRVTVTTTARGGISSTITAGEEKYMKPEEKKPIVFGV